MSEDVSVNAATPEQVIDWTRLMNRLPSHINPLNDPDGRFAHLGDVGKIHYLAGTMGGEAYREFDVDLGDTLVLPMINAWEWALENQAGAHDTLEDAARGFFDLINPQEAHLKIDLNNDAKNEGKFEVNLNLNLSTSTYFPDLNIEEQANEFYVESEKEFKFSNPKHNINGLPPRSYDAYAVGYWAQIEDIPLGTHKIVFGGTLDLTQLGMSANFEISVTDIVTVVDPSADCLM